MKRKIVNILTVMLITLSSCLGSVYPQTTPVKAETTEVSSKAESEQTSNQLIEVEGELNVDAIQIIQKDKQRVALKVVAKTEDETIRINGIRGPDGIIVDGNKTTYIAPCNGTYEFEVFYEKDGEELSQLYYEYVFDSNRMTDGNRPSKANGFYFEEPSINLMADEGAATGAVYKKLYPFKVNVDGKDMGPGNWHYVAYMQDSEGRTLLCMEDRKSVV